MSSRSIDSLSKSTCCIDRVTCSCVILRLWIVPLLALWVCRRRAFVGEFLSALLELKHIRLLLVYLLLLQLSLSGMNALKQLMILFILKLMWASQELIGCFMISELLIDQHLTEREEVGIVMTMSSEWDVSSLVEGVHLLLLLLIEAHPKWPLNEVDFGLLGFGRGIYWLCVGVEEHVVLLLFLSADLTAVTALRLSHAKLRFLVQQILKHARFAFLFGWLYLVLSLIESILSVWTVNSSIRQEVELLSSSSRVEITAPIKMEAIVDSFFSHQIILSWQYSTSIRFFDGLYFHRQDRLNYIPRVCLVRDLLYLVIPWSLLLGWWLAWVSLRDRLCRLLLTNILFEVIHARLHHWLSLSTISGSLFYHSSCSCGYFLLNNTMTHLSRDRVALRLINCRLRFQNHSTLLRVSRLVLARSPWILEKWLWIFDRLLPSVASFTLLSCMLFPLLFLFLCSFSL